MRLFEAVGPENARNEQYLGHALVAAALVELDGELCEPVATKRQLEARVVLLDEHGMTAVDSALASIADESSANPGPMAENG